jgi:hypothetical protein
LPIEHLGYEAAELLSLTNGSEARSLNRLAELAAWQVPACAGAHAAVWRDGEVIGAAATHPDLAELADLQLDLGRGPLVVAADEGLPVSCPDTLTETRWPEYAAAALRRSVRCSVHLVRDLPRGALVLSLFGVRPGVLDAQSNPMADTLAAFGGAMLANATAYGQAQRTASQLKDAVVARSVVDQAKGVLMHALGCDADDALRRLRQESQRRHVKVTEVASRGRGRLRQREPEGRRVGGPPIPARAGLVRRRLHLRDQDRHVVAQLVLGKAGHQALHHPGGLGGGPARQPGQLVGQAVLEVPHVRLRASVTPSE